MRYSSDRPQRYVGWQFEGLRPCPYTKDQGKAELTAHFRYVVLQDGVEVPQTAAIHLPSMIALNETDVRDMTGSSRATIMGVSLSLREEALKSFAPLETPKHTAQIIPMPRHAEVKELSPRQLAIR